MIQLEHISKRYVGPSGTVDALKDVSVHVEKGDIYGIIGSSGAGKSTLLRMVNQLEKPDTGTVTVAGRELSTLSKAELRKMRRKIGMVFQQFNLLESKTVFQNVAIPLILEGIPKEKITERVKEVLHIVELHDILMSLSFPADRNKGWVLPGRWQQNPQFSCVMKPPVHWIPRPQNPSSAS